VNTVRASVAAAASLVLMMSVGACGSSPKASPGALTSGQTIASSGGVSASTSASGAPQSGVPEANPAGDIPDNQAFVAVRDAAAGYTVSVPEGWSQTADAGAVVFSDKYNVVRILTRTVSSPPTVGSVTRTELPAVAATAPGYAPGSVSTVGRKAGQAVLATYRANSATNPVTGKYAVEAVERYVFYRAGREVILTLAAPVGSDNVDPWRRVTDSFGWL
jgi:hypothetical protein